MGADQNQQTLFDPVPASRLSLLSHKELVEFAELQQKIIERVIQDNKRLSSLSDELEQRTLLVEDQYIVLKNRLFGKSSEKEGRPEDKKEPKKRGPLPPRTKVQLPSERYPDATRIKRDIEFKEAPPCNYWAVCENGGKSRGTGSAAAEFN